MQIWLGLCGGHRRVWRKNVRIRKGAGERGSEAEDTPEGAPKSWMSAATASAGPSRPVMLSFQVI